MNTTLTKPIRFAEYLLLPYDGQPTELVDGKIIKMTEASPLHDDYREVGEYREKELIESTLLSGLTVAVDKILDP